METFAHPTARHPGDLDALAATSRLEGSHTFDSAHRTARDIRVSRIHAMWRRTCRNFREAYFAYRLADSARDAAAQLSAERRQATQLCDRAQRRMTHWNKRSAALAMAEIELALKPIPGGLDAC